MIMLKRGIEEFFDECDELVNSSLEQSAETVNMDSVMNVSETDLAMAKKGVTLYKTAKEISIKMAEMMDEQDRKLDKILRLIEKLEEQK